VIDFSDQIELASGIVNEHPEIVAEHRARFDAVLLDEYQDTNVAQARLMRSIFGDGHPVTAVGDPDQNIYAWRGASLYNLIDFPAQFPRLDGSPAARLTLYTNFRSGSRILAAADTLIAPLPADQRPDPDKQLRPHPPNGDGEVHVQRHLDEWAEATTIADRAVSLHGNGARWASMAVLCRTSRLFESLQRAFGERSVPVEIVGLAGLLKLPEIVEVLAYARAVQDPHASVALARILLGPRYRVGFKDLAAVARLAKDKNIRFRDVDEEEAEAEPFLFAEALERLDEIEGLSTEGRSRLEEFRDELQTLRIEARKPVPEFLGEVIRMVGLLTEIDAEIDRGVAAAARRNLAAFLDQVHAFEPVEGELTLRAFLDYIDQVERLDKQEWAPVQPSDEDSVKIMTIHVAKGLEFDHVFVPGFAHDLLPNPKIPQNPAERGKSLDFELRGDAAILPRYEGNLSRFKGALRDQEIVEERRTAYVAITRARRTLWVSGAYWYSENVRPKKPSIFLDELADWGEATKAARVDRGPQEPGDVNPLLGLRASFVRDWPGPALRPEADDLFPAGWRAAAAQTPASGGVDPSLIETLEPRQRQLFDRTASDRRELARHLREREEDEGQIQAPAAPQTVSASGIIDYERCPKRFYWSTVRPLPRFSGPAARIGTEIHRWIERRASGQGRLLEPDDEPDLTSEELAGEPGKVERLRSAFIGSRFAGRTPLFAERAFLLRLEEVMVSGRIDAIYADGLGGPWEIVDWKTGRPPDEGDPLSRLQLDVYGLACLEIWRKKPEEISLTYLYLATGEERTHTMEDPGEVRARVVRTLRSIAAGSFEPTPGPQCHHCDFRAFCDAGQSWLRAEDLG
jgi:DNA helicase-2/ATP-dependent DNA helicase PcrA